MKTTLVLLPGLNGTTGLFNPLLECVPDDIAVLPISYPAQEKLSYSQLTSFVLDKIEQISGKYIILGESFSGPISLFISERKPAGLVGVVLVATFITAPNFKVGRFLPWTIGFSFAKPLYSVRLALSNKKNQPLIASISTELQNVSPQVLSYRIEEIFAVNATESLRNCDVPVVYFRGVKDFVVPKKNLLEILAVKPEVKVIEFDAQHFLLQSEPVKACKEIQRFAEECALMCIDEQ